MEEKKKEMEKKLEELLFDIGIQADSQLPELYVETCRVWGIKPDPDKLMAAGDKAFKKFGSYDMCYGIFDHIDAEKMYKPYFVAAHCEEYKLLCEDGAEVEDLEVRKEHCIETMIRFGYTESVEGLLLKQGLISRQSRGGCNWTPEVIKKYVMDKKK